MLDAASNEQVRVTTLAQWRCQPQRLPSWDEAIVHCSLLLEDDPLHADMYSSDAEYLYPVQRLVARAFPQSLAQGHWLLGANVRTVLRVLWRPEQEVE
jgi:hypothetical protein